MNLTKRADVAVVVPTFNRLDLLKETVESLRKQTATNARFIMVDDNSYPATQEYLSELAANDDRFVFIEKPHDSSPGCQTSRNIGLDACNAEAVVFLDSDDLLAPEALEKRYALLSQSPQADIVIAPQAIFTTDFSDARWVNIPRPGVTEVDRFLEITHPIDVPWVNGGVMIRTSALKSANVRWRTEFDWDDVAFHFECLISGLKPIWMEFDEPDSWYRMHNGPRYGKTLFTMSGIQSAARMISWMYQELTEHGLACPARRSVLMRALYRACVLPSISARKTGVTQSIIRTALEDGLLTEGEAKNLLTYTSGRKNLSLSNRATYYWNRFSDRRLLASFLDDRPSTYASVAVNQLPQTAN